MSQPAPEQHAVQTEMVVQVLREQLAQLTWQLTLTEARARTAEGISADLMAQLQKPQAT